VLLEEEDGVQCSNAHIVGEDGGSPSGGGDKLEIVDGLARLQVDNSLDHLTRNFIRRWNYIPLHIFNQEERKTVSEVIGVEEREEEARREEMSEEEGEFSTNSPREVLALKIKPLTIREEELDRA
jgi:hypothetical protein